MTKPTEPYPLLAVANTSVVYGILLRDGRDWKTKSNKKRVHVVQTLLSVIYFLCMKSFGLGGFQDRVLCTLSACSLHDIRAVHNIFDDDVNWC